MTPKPFQVRHMRRLSRVSAACLGISLLACGLVPTPQPTPPPVVVTVLVTAAATPDNTQPTVTSAPEIPSPTATFAPPPAPDFPQVSRGAPNGDNQDNFRISLDFTPAYFLRAYVFYSQDPNEKFDASQDGRDIQSVEFIVSSPDGGKQYYDHTENNAGYCFFGGGEPDCNPWTLEGGQYVWKSGGPVVRSGKYALTINVTAQNGDVGSWIWNKQSGNSILISVP